MTDIKNWCKVAGFVLKFMEKFLLCAKWDKLGIFSSKIKSFKLFFKFFHQILLKLYLMTVTEEWRRVTLTEFGEKKSLSSK